MPVKSRQNIAETDRGLHYNKEEWLGKSLDGKGGFSNGNESHDSDNDDENYNENKNSSSYGKVLLIVATK